MEAIIGVQFGISSPQDILKSSVVEITTEKTYVGTQPVTGGVFDPRFGGGARCPTCNQTPRFCPGHFGHIVLARPQFLIQFLPYTVKVLRCICVRCSRLLVDADSADVKEIHKGVPRNKVLDEMAKLCKGTAFCGKYNSDGCGCVQPTIQKEKKTVATIKATWKPEKPAANAAPTDAAPVAQEEILSAEYVLRLFQRMLDKDIEALGLSPVFSHPAWMIATLLAVPPLTVRPSVMRESRRMEDDITHKLIDIIKRNQGLRERIDRKDPADVVDKWNEMLQYDVATLVDNNISGVPQAQQRSGRPLKTLGSRLSGKTGRFRGNLMGKRVDFSARSVITPDPNIEVDELGVPMEIAMNLTIPEAVTPFNRARLQKAVDVGPSAYPGAKKVELAADGRVINLKIRGNYHGKLQDGDMVHRHLLDGDFVLFNRQPSLHRMSMMGHRVRVLPGRSFRMNPSAAKPYNADGPTY